MFRFRAEYEYVVVGTGAGDGTLAARLAEAGRTVLVLEASDDPLSGAGESGGSTSATDYQVPMFHWRAARPTPRFLGAQA